MSTRSLRSRVFLLFQACILFQAIFGSAYRFGSQVSAEGDQQATATKALSPQRVAIVVSGSLQRYMFSSVTEHLIAPMVRDGHTVDYYLALSTGHHVPWRNGFSYMHKLTMDPAFGEMTKQKKPDHHKVKEIISKGLEKVGGRLQRLDWRESMDLEDDPELSKLRTTAKALFPEEDPDTRFPVTSLGHGVIADANRNLLRLYRAMGLLFDQVEKKEAKHGKYDYVFFMRDDTHWMGDFHLSNVVGHGTSDTDLYVLSCDAREPAMLDSEINDHAQLFTREKASVIGKYYSWLTTGKAAGCKVGERPCDSEELMKWMFSQQQVKIATVGQKHMPFERCVHVKDQGEVQVCMHKYCNSRENSLAIGELAMCKK